MNAPTSVMREPKLVPEPALPIAPRRRVVANPALPNLIIVKRVGAWPIGAVIEKSAMPNGFLGHLEMGVVVETERPATHGTRVKPSPATADDPVAEINRQRGVIAEYEGQLASAQEQLAAKEQLITRLQGDLAAAEEMIASLSTAREVVESSGSESGLVAVGVAPPENVPVAPAPWKG